MVSVFFLLSIRYYAAFIDIYHRARRDNYLNGNLAREYIWPTSFPHCTPALRMYPFKRMEKNPSYCYTNPSVEQFVNRWIEEALPRGKLAKCLILIGPTDTGK